MDQYFQHGFIQKCASEQVPAGAAQYLLMKAAGLDLEAIKQFMSQHQNALIGGGAGALGGAGLGALAGGEENRGTGAALGALGGAGLGGAAGAYGPDILKALMGPTNIPGAGTDPRQISPDPMVDQGLKRFGAGALQPAKSFAGASNGAGPDLGR